MILGVINQQTTEHFTVSDTNGNLISGIDSTAFTVHVYNPSGVEVTGLVSGVFSELGDGNYKYIFTPSSNGIWYVVVIHPTYFPWGKTDDVQVYENDLTEIYNTVKRTLGLTHENIYIDNPVYGDNGSLIAARVRIYSNAASVGSTSDVIETYLIQADEVECGKFSYWSQIKV